MKRKNNNGSSHLHGERGWREHAHRLLRRDQVVPQPPAAGAAASAGRPALLPGVRVLAAAAVVVVVVVVSSPGEPGARRRGHWRGRLVPGVPVAGARARRSPPLARRAARRRRRVRARARRLDVPVLYFALLSIGAVVSPANPALTPAEVSRLVSLSGASVAFAVSSTATKLPAGLTTVVLLDSPHFRSLLMDCGQAQGQEPLPVVVVRQSETAAIQYSSGTTGRVKAAALPHRSFIAMVAGFHALRAKAREVRTLLGAPMFHSMGFLFVLQGVALGATTVVVTDAVARAGIRGLVEAAERWAVMDMTASPPVVLGMTKQRCRLPALERITCGGAPLPAAAIERFRRRFPHVDLCMVSHRHVQSENFFSGKLPVSTFFSCC